jgi:hypothetical protein
MPFPSHIAGNVCNGSQTSWPENQRNKQVPNGLSAGLAQEPDSVNLCSVSEVPILYQVRAISLSSKLQRCCKA